MTTNPYPLSTLATMWEREQLTSEQMIGQLLIHINLLQQSLSLLLSQARPQPPVNSAISSAKIEAPSQP